MNPSIFPYRASRASQMVEALTPHPLRNFCCALAILLSWIPVQSQTPVIDSLKRELVSPHSNRLSVLFALCLRGESIPSDTMMQFAQEAKRISLRNGDEPEVLQSGFYIAQCYYMRGRADTALKLCDEGLQQIKDIHSMLSLYRDFMRYKIASLTKLRKIKESITECYKLLENSETHEDLFGRVIAYNNLGVNNNILENRKEAVDWFNKAYALVKDDSSYKNIPSVFTNLSAVYFYQSKNDSGFFFLRKAIAIARMNENLKTESDCYTMQGMIYTEQNKIDSAETVLKKAVVIQKQIGNVQNILVGLDALESFYAKQKKYSDAIACIKQAEQYSLNYSEPITFSFYNDLADCYKQMKNYKAYGETLDTLIRLKDSLYRKSKADDLAHLEAQYEVTSKEAFIAKQKLELLHKDIWIAGSVTVTLLVLAIVYFSFRQYQRKQKMAVKDAEEKERNRVAAELHDDMGTRINILSHAASQLMEVAPELGHQIKETSDDLMQSLRETVWTLKQESILSSDVWVRFKNFISKLRNTYSTIKFEIREGDSSEKKLQYNEALHLIRILQESTGNAIRHAGCTEIVCEKIASGSSILFRVRDNGKGMSPVDENNPGGNGIPNMQQRARESNFGFSIQSQPGSGTTVEIFV